MFRKYKSPFPQSLSFFVPTLFYLEYFSHHLVKSFRSVLSIICRYSFISTVTIYVLFLTILIRTASVSHMPEPAYMPIPSSPISSFSLNDLPMLKACVISDTSSIPFPWFRISRSLPRILISIDGDSPSIAFSQSFYISEILATAYFINYFSIYLWCYIFNSFHENLFHSHSTVTFTFFGSLSPNTDF